MRHSLLPLYFSLILALPLEITLPLGQLQGVGLSPTLNGYFNIPYAEPPIGANRFRPPLPVTPWSDTLNATTFGAICPQSLNSSINSVIANFTFYPDRKSVV